METLKPILSVCIPVYNGERYLEEAIESVLFQKFTDYELIISDNNSSDSTPDILHHYEAIDKRVRCLFNKENIGPTGNFDRCLREARGIYIKFLCADDILIGNDCLDKFLRFYERDPGLALVASARRIIDASSSFVQVSTTYLEGLTAPGGAIIRDCLLRMNNRIGEPTAVMFRRDLALRGFNTKYTHLLDLEMWFHLLLKGNFAYSAEPLVGFRVHDEQGTVQNLKNLVHLNDDVRLLEEYAETPGYSIGKTVKRYLVYIFCHRIWDSARTGMISREYATSRIREHFSMPIFYLLMPFYKYGKKLVRQRARKLLRLALTN